ncbi:hypothetical protein [Amorphus coralli]|uniref:hypothetical protein n=1 Tax=Amorphus coralli TaxID=340680 RepID=UPI0003829187|nr:hypothetical protein [Amorphus coralli]
MSRSTLTKISLAAVLVCLALVYRGFQEPAVTDYAFGCDPFGYQRQAELFREKGYIDGLDTQIVDEEGAFLLALAPSVGVSPRSYAEMTAPHCHHYEPKSERVILQYPPGTGFLLSLLPADRQVDLLYVAAFSLLVLCFGLYAAAAAPSLALTASVVGSLFVSALVINHSALMVSYSAPATLGLTAVAVVLVLAGLPIGRPPRWWAGALLGLLSALLVAVRIPNLFLLAGLAAFIVVQVAPWQRGRLSGFLAFTLSGLVTFAIGLIPLLAANRINAGGLFDTTYGAADSAGASLDPALIAGHLLYYFAETPAWPLTIVALAALVMAAWLSLGDLKGEARRRMAAATIGGGLPFLVSIGFFVTHEVTASYYLVPSAFFCLALCAFVLVEINGGRAFTFLRTGSVAAVVLIMAALQVAHLPYRPYSIMPPAEILAPGAIVWADRVGSSLYHYRGKYAAKIPFGLDCEQNAMVNGVSAAGRPQYFVVDSRAMNRLVTRLQKEDLLDWAGVLAAMDTYAVYRMKPGGNLKAC